jgi:NAD(P) transhydrogenase subunit alpha
MIVGVLKEPSTEKRVSLLPEAVATLKKNGHTVLVELDAGLGASAFNTDYEKAGAEIKSAEEVIAACDVILSIHPPDSSFSITASKILIGVYQVLFNASLVQKWAQAGLTVFSMEMLPRTTRAQSMDVLSSQANIAGYKAVLLAAHSYPRYFPMFMTAAGSVAPAKVLILGAGVAGLQPLPQPAGWVQWWKCLIPVLP